MEFLKKIFNKKDTKNNGLKILNLFGDYDEKKGKLTIENENKELEQALADCATTYVETLTDLSQMPPAERDQVRIDARKKHNTEIKQLRNNKAAVLLQKYQNKYKSGSSWFTGRQFTVMGIFTPLILWQKIFCFMKQKAGCRKSKHRSDKSNNPIIYIW